MSSTPTRSCRPNGRSLFERFATKLLSREEDKRHPDWIDAADPEAVAAVQRLSRTLVNDVEGIIARLKDIYRLSDEDVDNWRTFATWPEARFVESYTGTAGERRRQPVWWDDGRFNRPTQPVVGINWYEAMAYAAWLARVTGQPYRLPTEAEWEWAARRGERRYPWVGDWDAARCNSAASRLDRPSPVGVYPHGATPDGLHDLAGNVYEWTASRYRPYPYRPDDGREDPIEPGLRVARGGSWYVDQRLVRCAYRCWYDPRGWHDFLGYRLARTLSWSCCLLSFAHCPL